jgi:CRISPR type I-E-associated protein CasB/Cse2
MSAERADPHQLAVQLLEYLRKLQHDRGAMADLRRALNPAQRYRAWPLLARVGGIGDPRYETVAGLFACHPEQTHTGNFGTTCRTLSRDHGTFEGRFRRLLGCSRRDDLYSHIRPIVLAAKAKSIPVNYEQLFADLSYWGEAVKARWAAEFWGAPEAAETTAPTVMEVTA